MTNREEAKANYKATKAAWLENQTNEKLDRVLQRKKSLQTIRNKNIKPTNPNPRRVKTAGESEKI